MSEICGLAPQWYYRAGTAVILADKKFVITFRPWS
jgi:hypothetical protein